MLRDVQLRELLRWCLPALVIGLVLRAVLTMQMPFAYFHDDAPDFLTTPDKLFHEGEFELHEKKTFLVPVLFTLPFLLPVPAAVTIPLAQHVLGLGLVLMIGALCRLWLATWKVWIVPLTTLAAVNPFFLWYEQTLMAETIFVVCTVFVALAGTLYARQQTLGRFAALCVSLVLEAGARPEGKLLFGFGLLLVAWIHWRELAAHHHPSSSSSSSRPTIKMRMKMMMKNTAARRFGALTLVALVTHLCTKTSQAGLLLYTAVARLTPAELRCAPGFDAYIAPIRADLQRRWDEHPQFARVSDRKAISAAVKQYLTDQGADRVRSESSNAFCLRLAKETCLRNLPALPGLTLAKFRLVATESPAGPFNNGLLFDKQREAYIDNAERTLRLAPGLLGAHLADATALQRWIDTHYGEVRWFNTLNERWLRAVNRLRLPDARYPGFVYYGVPLYFVAGAIGVLVAMFRRGELQRFHIAWSLTLLGYFFVILLTANVRPRFRFVFEPFWFIYAALLIDSLWLGIRALVRR